MATLNGIHIIAITPVHLGNYASIQDAAIQATIGTAHIASVVCDNMDAAGLRDWIDLAERTAEVLGRENEAGFLVQTKGGTWLPLHNANDLKG